jgi:cytochrome c peroxidase
MRQLCGVALILALGWTNQAFAQLRPSPEPAENPNTPDKEVLGKILFWEEQMGTSNTMACGTCHRPASGGSDPRSLQTPGLDGMLGTADDVHGSPGVRFSDASLCYLADPVRRDKVLVTGRYSPSFIMAQYAPDIFWDGRATSEFTDPEQGTVSIPFGGALESQSVGPPLSVAEMGNVGRTWPDITSKLQTAVPMQLASNLPADITAALAVNTTYPDLFNAAFGDPAITAERIAFAIAAYERTLIPDQAPVDDYLQGDLTALTPDQEAGLQLFVGSADCRSCHPAVMFSDFMFRNIGLRPVAEDIGRQAVTGDVNDRGKFKVPSLRNVALRDRFMHNGQFDNLRDVVEFYDRGGDFSDNLDSLIMPLNMTVTEIDQLTEFMEVGLTDPRVAQELPPFDRPTLHSESNPANPLIYGTGSTGSGGIEPVMIADSPPHVLNTEWRIGIGEGRGGALALLAISAASDNSIVNGVPFHVAFSPAPLMLFRTLSGVGAGEGYGTVLSTIPNLPVLQGLTVYAQWFVADGAAAGGVAATSGAQLDLF